MNIKPYRVPQDEKVNLSDYPTTEGKKKENETIRDEVVPPLVEKLKTLHEKLNAE